MDGDWLQLWHARHLEERGLPGVFSWESVRPELYSGRFLSAGLVPPRSGVGPYVAFRHECAAQIVCKPPVVERPGHTTGSSLSRPAGSSARHTSAGIPQAGEADQARGPPALNATAAATTPGPQHERIESQLQSQGEHEQQMRGAVGDTAQQHSGETSRSMSTDSSATVVPHNDRSSRPDTVDSPGSGNVSMDGHGSEASARNAGFRAVDLGALTRDQPYRAIADSSLLQHMPSASPLVPTPSVSMSSHSSPSSSSSTSSASSAAAAAAAANAATKALALGPARAKHAGTISGASVTCAQSPAGVQGSSHDPLRPRGCNDDSALQTDSLPFLLSRGALVQCKCCVLAHKAWCKERNLMLCASAAAGDCGESANGSAPIIAPVAGTDPAIDLDDDDRLERATWAVSALTVVSQRVVDACTGSSYPPWSLLPVDQEESSGGGRSSGSKQRGNTPQDLKQALLFAGVSWSELVSGREGQPSWPDGSRTAPVDSSASAGDGSYETSNRCDAMGRQIRVPTPRDRSPDAWMRFGHHIRLLRRSPAGSLVLGMRHPAGLGQVPAGTDGTHPPVSASFARLGHGFDSTARTADAASDRGIPGSKSSSSSSSSSPAFVGGSGGLHRAKASQSAAESAPSPPLGAARAAFAPSCDAPHSSYGGGKGLMCPRGLLKRINAREKRTRQQRQLAQQSRLQPAEHPKVRYMGGASDVAEPAVAGSLGGGTGRALDPSPTSGMMPYPCIRLAGAAGSPFAEYYGARTSSSTQSGPASSHRGAVGGIWDDAAYVACVQAGVCAAFDVVEKEGKGRCVVAAAPIPEGGFFAEYGGQLIDGNEAARRAEAYKIRGFGSYMFEFRHGGALHCVDATAERAEYGPARLLSHSRHSPNLVPRKVVVMSVPRLAMVALRDIAYGEELSYDYGETSPAVLAAFPWLRDS